MSSGGSERVIKFKNKLGEFEFDRVEDLKEFLRGEDIEDFDMRQFGYLISNLTKHNKLSAYCAEHGLSALIDLRKRGMDAVVKELSK